MATLLAAGVAGCAQANSGRTGEPTPDASVDARAIDAPPSVLPDAAIDAELDASPDAGCAISVGLTPQLDGVADLDDYPAAQRLAPGAQLGSDAVAIAWDASRLYITASSTAFEADYKPLHVYVETGTALPSAVPGSGKEYSGLTPMLPFTPTHLVAARRTTGATPYNGVYLPAASWTTRDTALQPGADVFVSADHRTLSIAVPWAALGGCPTALRLAVHVVHAVSANEWKDLVPASHTPWQAPGGGYYEIDLTGTPAVSGWALR
jgi:hypothetical protein